MNKYLSLDKDSLKKELEIAEREYNNYKKQGLNLNMSRGKPSKEQTDLSLSMLQPRQNDLENDYVMDEIDCKNYGGFDGLPSIKKFFSKMMGIEEENIFVGGNSSLNLMFDIISFYYTHGATKEDLPWCKQKKVKFLCPVPGYDRHFAITEFFGIEMIEIPMLENGPCMDKIEELVEKDESIKGIWCVPKYSNPTGNTYSDETVKRFARLKPLAKDFRIMWDNAYCVHDLVEDGDKLLDIMNECKKNGTQDMPIIFTSTSKITFPGAGVSAIGASKRNMELIKERYKYATIGYNKLNQYGHVKFLKNFDNLLNHMKKHREILKPKFDLVDSILEQNLGQLGIATWTKPRGGYFVSVDLVEGTAKKVVELCKNVGVILTDAGATYPYGIEEKDKNIRIAPTYPPLTELEKAMNVFCCCVKITSIKKIMCKDV